MWQRKRVRVYSVTISTKCSPMFIGGRFNDGQIDVGCGGPGIVGGNPPERKRAQY
jgi:hypothetical protein